MSHPNPSHDRKNEYHEDKVTSYKRQHNPLSNISKRKGKSSQLGNLVQDWKHSMMSPHEKALDKSVRRNKEK